MKLLHHLAGLATALGVFAPAFAAEPTPFLNVSYSYTKGFFNDYNPGFAASWKEKTGQQLVFSQSHAASGSQSQKVTAGELDADVVTLAAPPDIDRLHPTGNLIPADWASRYGNNSAPYGTLVVLVVRPGNPKGVSDWNDLAEKEIKVLTSNPKICGGGRWNYLAPFGYALRKNGGDTVKAEAFVDKIYDNVPVCYKGVGLSAKAFFEGTGDVLITYENVILDELAKKPDLAVQIVYPSITVEVELPVAVVEANARKHGTLEAAQAYLAGLYSPEAQRLFAKHNFRPSDAKVAAEVAARFQPVKTFKVQEAFRDWGVAQESQFAADGVFSRIYKGELLF